MNYKKITDTIVGGIRDLHEEIDNLQQENTQLKQLCKEFAEIIVASEMFSKEIVLKAEKFLEGNKCTTNN